MVFFIKQVKYVITLFCFIKKKRNGAKMENHEIIFKKIEAKEKEWDEQIECLRLKATGFDTETRLKIETQIDILNSKLKDLEKRTSTLKKNSSSIQSNMGDQIVHSWVELFTKIDNAMLRLKE